MNIKQYLKEKKILIDNEIEKLFPRRITREWLEFALGKASFAYDVETISQSMAEPIWEYLGRGGKRWRPALCLLCCEAVGGKEEQALPFTPLVELVHTGCVTEETLITDASGVPKKITELKEGEKVLSVNHDGSIVAKKIMKTHDNGVKDVFKLKTHNREIVATKNHPFLVVSKEQPIKMQLTEYGRLMIGLRMAQLGYTISGFCRKVYPFLPKNTEFCVGHLRNALSGYKNCLLPVETVEVIASTLGMETGKCWKKKKCLYHKAEVKLEWKKLDALRKGDLIVVAKEILPQNGELPKIPKIKQSHRDRNKIPKEFTLEMAQLAGFILGDGYIDLCGRVMLCIPQNQEGREEYIKLIENIFGAKPSVSKDTVTIYSRAVASIFEMLGLAKHSLEKDLPDWVFKLPKSHKLAFVKGYLDSDGTVGKKGTVRFECASKKIISKLKALLDSMGFTTSNVTEREVDNTHFERYANKKKTKLYSVQLYSRNRVLEEIGSEIMEYRTRLGRVAQRMVEMKFRDAVPNLPANFSKKAFGFSRIIEIRYVGKKHTYDLQIEGTHNYISNGIVSHNTIVVDDIEDDSKERRGKPCMHLLYGLDIASNNSDALYFIGLIPLYRNTQSLPAETKNKIYDLYGEELLRVCTGQAMDILWHKGKKVDISEQEYLQMTVYKTGVLARFAAKLGSILGHGTKEQTIALGKFGEALGVGFQIQDDILELTEKEFQKGKGLAGGDIHEGKRTLLVIKTLEKANVGDKKRLLEILDSHSTDEKTISEAIAIIQKYGAIDYAKRRAEEIVNNAWEQTNPLLPETSAKSLLKELAEFAIKRKI